MESLVIIITFVVGIGAFTYVSKGRAAEEARVFAESEARRRKKEEEAQRRVEEARRREAERQSALDLRVSIKNAINVAVNAAIEATIIGTGITEDESKVVHIVASAIEAAGVAESTDASVQTRAGEMEAARRVALTDAVTRSDTNATTAARKAASLEPSERTKIIKDTRIAAIEVTMAIAIKDTLAILRANGGSREIKNVRENAISLNTLTRIGEATHEIEYERTNEIQQARTSENERIEAIIAAIETPNETYASIASSIAAGGRANAIKGTRKYTRNDTSKLIVTKAIELVTKDAITQVEVVEGAIVAKIMAAITTNVLDKIEDAIEDAVAATCMRSGSIQDTIAPSIANAIEISTQDVIYEIIDEARVSTGDEEDTGEDYDIFYDPDEIPNQFNVPIDNYQNLPRLEHPAGYVYVIQDITHTMQYKIGRTNHPTTRINNFGVELPFKTEIIAILKTTDAVGLERELHNQYAIYRTQGEWFDLADEHVNEILHM